MKYLILVLGGLILIPGMCYGQNRIEKSKGRKYNYESQSYKTKELKVVFENSGDPLALDYYNKFNKKRKLKKAAFIITGATLLLTPLLLTEMGSADPPPPTGGSPPPGGGSTGSKDISGYVIGGVIALGVVTIIISSSQSKKDLDKAIEQFNEGKTSSLSLGVTKHGFGLNLSF